MEIGSILIAWIVAAIATGGFGHNELKRREAEMKKQTEIAQQASPMRAETPEEK